MRGTPWPDGALEFIERFVALLDGGRYTATYKFAVLTSLLDLLVEGVDVDGHPPEDVSGRRIGQRVLRLLWRQADAYPAADPGAQPEPRFLRHSTGPNDLVTKIRAFKQLHGLGALTFENARSRVGADLKQLEEEVMVTVIRMPIPKLQRVHGGDPSSERFLYDFSWKDEVSEAQVRRPEFDDTLRLRLGVGELLVRLEPVLRPMIQQRWTSFVAARSTDVVEDRVLDEFLFGATRISLEPVRDALLEAQGDRCFYCEAPHGTAQVEVDHFVPWSRHPDNGLHNLVVADRACNNAKRDSLAGHHHLERWLRRFTQRTAEGRAFHDVVQVAAWQSNRERTLGAGRAAYLWRPAGSPLWVSRDNYESASPDAIRELLVSTV